MTSTPRLKLPYITTGQAQKGPVSYKKAVDLLDALAQPTVINMTTTAPPGSPSNGDAYVIAATASGDWLTKEDQIAVYEDGWLYTSPLQGMMVYNQDDDVVYVYRSSAWNAVVAGLDYETGTFTPTADFVNTLDFVPTYNTQVGKYWVLGDLVYVFYELDFDSNAFVTANGNFKIGGLPYSAVNDADTATRVGLAIARTKQITITNAFITCCIYKNTNFCVLMDLASAAAGSVCQATTNVPASTTNIGVQASGFYWKG